MTRVSLRRLFLLSVSVVGSLLILIALLVLSSLGLVGSSLLVVQGLPSLAKNLANLAEADAGVLIANILTLLIGKEHVGGQTTLWCVGILLLLLGAALGGTLGGLLLRHCEVGCVVLT